MTYILLPKCDSKMWGSRKCESLPFCVCGTCKAALMLETFVSWALIAKQQMNAIQSPILFSFPALRHAHHRFYVNAVIWTASCRGGQSWRPPYGCIGAEKLDRTGPSEYFLKNRGVFLLFISVVCGLHPWSSSCCIILLTEFETIQLGIRSQGPNLLYTQHRTNISQFPNHG